MNFIDGTFKNIFEYDKYGIVLSYKFYPCGNEVSYEQILIDISTDQPNISEYLKGDGFYKNSYITKTYCYSFKDECSYLKKEGVDSNGKRIGEWKFYNKDGSIKKIKTY